MEQFVGLDVSQDSTHVCVKAAMAKWFGRGPALRRQKGSQVL